MPEKSGRPRAILVLALVLGPCAVIVGAGLLYMALRHRPGDGGETAATPQPPVQPARPEPPPPRRSPFFEEVDRLEREGRLGEAIQKLDEFSPRLSSEEDAVPRVKFRLARLEKKAAELLDARPREAGVLAAEGKLREAVDRLADVAALGASTRLAPRVTEAYRQLRRAADDHLAARRKESLIRVEQELTDLRSRVGPTAPARALAEANERFAAGEFTAVLLAAERLLESGAAVEGLTRLLNLCATRAPLDEAVLRLYERALEKHPSSAALWASLGILHTWRQDATGAADVARRAAAKDVRFGPGLLEVMRLYGKLSRGGFPPGKPLYVDFVGPYEIVTDAGPAAARKLAGELEEIAREYAEIFPHSRNPNLRMRVMLFESQGDYSEYHRDLFGRTANESGVLAFYWPAIKQLVVAQGDAEGVKHHQVVRHEAFHQWIDFFAPNSPGWLNEGLAAFFEKSLRNRAAFSPDYHARAVHGMPLFPPLKEFLTLSRGDWHESPAQALYYGQAWSYIYWLHRQGKASLLDEYLRGLVLGRPQAAAFAASFGKVDLDEHQRLWKAAVLGNAYDK